jgi:hypothetical protein
MVIITPRQNCAAVPWGLLHSSLADRQAIWLLKFSHQSMVLCDADLRPESAPDIMIPNYSEHHLEPD